MRPTAAALLAAAATSAWIAAAIGVLDHFTDPSHVGGRMLVVGAIAGAILSIGAVAAAPRDWRRLAIVAFGVWPFATFGLFLVWRIGVSAEQRTACEAGDAAECLELAERKLRRSRADEAQPLLERGCELGNGRACGTLAYRSEVPAEREALFGRACDAGVAQACVRLADLEDDPLAALDLVRRACEMGDPSACDRLLHENAANDD